MKRNVLKLRMLIERMRDRKYKKDQIKWEMIRDNKNKLLLIIRRESKSLNMTADFQIKRDLVYMMITISKLKTKKQLVGTFK